MSSNYISVILCLIIIGCSNSQSDNNLDSKKISILKEDLIIDPNLDNNLAFPSFVRTSADYFFIYDLQLGKIFKYNYKGEKLSSFGRKGRGPGNFQSITNYWIMKDEIIFYDFNAAKLVYYDLQGTFVKEKIIGAEILSVINAKLYNNKFVLPANDNKEALLKIVDYQTDDIVYLGNGYKDGENLDNNSIRDFIRRTSQIPEFMYNQVTLDAFSTEIYSLQNVTGILQKYSVEAGLIWEKNIQIPSQEILFDQYQEELFGQDQYLPSLNYANGIHAIEQGVAILLNVPKTEATTIVWVAKDGKSTSVVEYPNIKPSENFPLRFRIAKDIGSVIFVNSLEGKIFKADWPF